MRAASWCKSAKCPAGLEVHLAEAYAICMALTQTQVRDIHYFEVESDAKEVIEPLNLRSRDRSDLGIVLSW